MADTQNGPEAPGFGPGSGNGGNEDKKIRKFEAVIIILMGIIGGGFAGVVRRTMDHASYYGALSTGAVAAIALPGLIFAILRYIRGQS
ncbi:hypothetical protein AF335_04610 [Streptomyces eurocidicus]|uniref:Uncharacterized protein n=1 Tax=Streptomyces eurocidicus TaxID=66423 RepID=A0A2N8P3J4_STREU|nr:hypothetical protein [Streptomyces eurocidicus]MBB5117809.1 hypothetical protein [Streptomyces eurocidicus]MBF6055634.1 hypothetical protein [Streptomyces eurocidicus]PNE35592.1 hypothetical protein AF335_04610 [Streptomyces eurocidicus]